MQKFTKKNKNAPAPKKCGAFLFFMMKKFITAILAASSAFAACYAQDKALLETLVRKGMITQQEATQIARESVTVAPSTKTTKSIKVFGGGQGWYTWAKESVRSGTSSPAQISGFTLRYVKFGVDADLGAGWNAVLVTDFGTEGANRNYLDKVVASKKFDSEFLSGQIQFGLRKTNMGYEQNTDDFRQMAIERSIATDFFTRATNGKNFGSRTVGLFWDGTVSQIDGLYYGAAVTSGISEGGNKFFTEMQKSTALSFYANAGYKSEAVIDSQIVKFDFGVNFGYAPQGMIAPSGKKGRVLGVNPYLTAKWNDFALIAEFFLQSVEDYAIGGGRRTPMGANVTLAYTAPIGEGLGDIQPVVRWAYVAANGMPVGTSFSDNYYDEIQSVFVGVNWLASDSVKTSLGYEFGYYENGVYSPALVPPSSNRAYGNSVRAQVQVLF